jgi:hypothetical protein
MERGSIVSAENPFRPRSVPRPQVNDVQSISIESRIERILTAKAKKKMGMGKGGLKCASGRRRRVSSLKAMAQHIPAKNEADR